MAQIAAARQDERTELLGLVAAALAVALVACALAATPLPRLLLPTYPAAADELPGTWQGRTRITAVRTDVEGGEITTRVTPGNLDLSFVVGCPRGAGAAAVDVRIRLNGQPVGRVGSCTARGLTALGSASADAFWSQFGAAPGRPMRVGVSAAVPDGSVSGPVTGSVSRVPPVVYLGIYQAPPSTLPPRPTSAPRPAGVRPVATVALGAERATVPLITNLPSHARLWYAAVCAGHADALAYSVLAGTIAIGSGSCSSPPELRQLALARLPTDEASGGTLTADVSLTSNYGESLTSHPALSDAAVVLTIYRAARS